MITLSARRGVIAVSVKPAKFTLDPRIDATLDLFAKMFPEKVDGKEHPTRPTGQKVNGYGLRQLIHDEIARALRSPYHRRGASRPD